MNSRIAILVCGLTLVLAGVAGANHHEHGDMPEMSKEQRQKMAVMHDTMAACLRSDKPMKQCHEDMMKSCHDEGENGCPMMGDMMGEMKGHGHGHGHDEHPEAHASPKK